MLEYAPIGTRVKTLSFGHLIASDGSLDSKYILPGKNGCLTKDYHHGDDTISVDFGEGSVRIRSGFVSFYLGKNQL